MCLAIPGRVVSLNEGDMATIALGDVRKEVSLALVENVSVGDYVLIHVGYALNTISVEEAERTLAMFAEAGIGIEESLGEPPGEVVS